MGCALALSLLLASSALELQGGVDLEARASRFTPDGGAGSSRAAGATTPRAALVLTAPTLRASAGYAATLWTSDVGAQGSALLSQSVDARLEARPDRLWRIGATASGQRGETDPLATARLASATSATQVASTGPLPYERLQADARAQRELTERTAVSAGARWEDSRILRGGLRELMPPQHTAGVDADLTHLVTVRDALTLRASGSWGETLGVRGTTTALASAVDGTWRRAWSPILDVWARAGAGFTVTREPTVPARRDLLPVAGAGLTTRGPPEHLRVEVSGRIASFFDRFTGDVRPMADARVEVLWPLARHLSLAGQASGGRRLDGATTLGAADLRLGWTVRPGLTLSAGAVARLQRERRRELPSFDEAGLLAGASWTYGGR